jgi:hypothetical protein
MTNDHEITLIVPDKRKQRILPQMIFLLRLAARQNGYKIMLSLTYKLQHQICIAWSITVKAEKWKL